MKTKILIFDVETAPNLAYVWGKWKQNIGSNMMISETYLMSFAAKWLGDDNIIYEENRHNDELALVTKLFALFDEADIVVAHNGNKFDIPTVQGRGLVLGLTPPSPFKKVDTLLTAKKEFRFPSNTLADLAKYFECSPKLSHAKFPGFELWLECLKQNDAAWEEMREYNIQDILTLEEIYLKMRPWMKTHPNMGVFEEQERPVCPKCGSHHINFRGYQTTSVSKFHRFVCRDCGGWGRTRFNAMEQTQRANLTTNAI